MLKIKDEMQSPAIFHGIPIKNSVQTQEGLHAATLKLMESEELVDIWVDVPLTANNVIVVAGTLAENQKNPGRKLLQGKLVSTSLDELVLLDMLLNSANEDVSLTQEEIAQKLCCSQESVSANLETIRKKLKVSLEASQ